MIRPAEFDGLANVELPAGPLHLAIGMFDGVHLGHRAVIDAAVHAAKADGGSAAVLTFCPHPSTLFRPQEPTRLMLPKSIKTAVLRGLGIDTVITQAFTPDFACLPANAFLPWLKERLPTLVAIYVGENFRFGAHRAGDAAALIAGGQTLGLKVFSAPRITLRGVPVSSTRIRELLMAGEVKQANEFLGEAYRAVGVVTAGQRLGRTLGFPTLNIPWSPELRPRLGVYVVRVSGEKSPIPLPAVANYGLRPTVEKSGEPRLEVHVLGECPWGEGDAITVEWLRFLRPEMKFKDLAALRSQIARDRTEAAADFSLH